MNKRALALRGVWSRLGAGLVTGASDDDPSGIATYSQAGAQFGYQLAWTMLFTYPLMVGIQEISARIGRVTGQGIAGNIRQHYPSVLLQGIVVLLLCANTLNIGADLGAMAEAAGLLVKVIPHWIWVAFFGFVCVLTQIFFSHERYVNVLKWLTLVLLSYFAVLVVLHVSWAQVALAAVIPHFSGGKSLWLMVIAILGTTISPYLFFWQAGQEVEDTKAHPVRVPLLEKPSQRASAFSRIRFDTLLGMGVSNLVGLAILITTASTLPHAGIMQVDTSAQAAQALRPLAGQFAFFLFTAGIVGAGLLSIPVLAGSAAYALGEARRWPVGLARKPLHAKAFYITITVAVLLGALANGLSLSPMRALVYAAVINGVVAVPVMALLMRLAGNSRVMGKFVVAGPLLCTGWVATGIMGVAALGWAASALLAGGN